MNHPKNGMLAGLRASMPVAIAAAPFGLLFGALAVDNGFSVTQAVAMSALVFAGASQMVGIELFGQKIAPWLIVLSIFAVNFRHILYSAALARPLRNWSPWQRAVGLFVLTDPQFADSERKVEQAGLLPFAWYAGYGAFIYVLWIVEAWVGALFGRLIEDPHAIGLDFLLPVYFLGLVMGFRKRANWLPVVVVSAAAALLAIKFVGSPWHVSIGAIAGVLFAAMLPVKAKVEAE